MATVRARPPARTAEARENQMIAKAYDLAEERINNGTASSQIVAHFLKLGSTKERLEKDILSEQRKLIKAKTEALESSKDMKELYSEALNAMRRYTGSRGGEEDE